MNENFKIEEIEEEIDEFDEFGEFEDEDDGANIKVIGVGGGGGNMINHMINEYFSNSSEVKESNDGSELKLNSNVLNSGSIDLLVANTDIKALKASRVSRKNKIKLGSAETMSNSKGSKGSFRRKKRGLGAGMKPDVGAKSAEESSEQIKGNLEDTDILFIAAGLGGGTGTGASPVIAKIARELDILTIAVVTKPFINEGPKRAQVAEEGLTKLIDECDSILVIPNERLLDIVGDDVGVKDSFKMVDDVLSRAVIGMSSIILEHGESDINVDFADVETVMSYRGLALMGVGESQGANAAVDAFKLAVESPLFEGMNIDGAKGVLVHFYIHPDYPLQKINAVLKDINSRIDPNAHLITGTITNTNISPDTVKVTILATGFDEGSLTKTSIPKESIDKIEAKERESNELKRKEDVEVAKSPQKRVKRVKISVPDDEDIDIPTYLRRSGK